VNSDKIFADIDHYHRSWKGRMWNMWRHIKGFFNFSWHFRRLIKYPIQRARRGWSDRDAWGFDNYLAEVIAGGTTYIAKSAHGYPPQLNEIYAKDMWAKTTPEADNAAFKEWVAILKDISARFEAYNKDSIWLDNSIPDKKKVEVWEERYSEMMRLFVDFYPSMWT
jgi:enamine deaminase RidA (YjgF/YER057c/UK114 family)